MQRPKVFFKTFGCRTNLYDTQIMRQNLKDFEHTQDENSAQIVIINSCTVTNGADSSVRNYVRRAKEQGKHVMFAGCGVKTQGKTLFEQNLVQGVIGHSHKERINELLSLGVAGERFFCDDALDHIDSTIITEFVGKARAFIKIQEGCDFACSYCIIPSVRGRARSFPIEHIIKQVQILLDSGITEIVLTGTNVGSFGRDNATSLAKLLKALFALNGLRRIRIGSLEPSQIDEEFFSLLAHPMLERHLHIALQHTHNTMLKIMNRANRFEEDAKLLEKIAALGFAIGTDFIIAHPGETPEIWEQAFENLTSLPLTHIHPFIYSVRDGTPSASMTPRINGTLAKERLHRLNAHIAKSNRLFRERIYAQKTPLKILVEKRLGRHLFGLDEFFNKIIIESSAESKLDSMVWLDICEYEVQEENNYAKI